MVGAAVGSFCLTWLVYERLTPLSGGLGFFVAWYVLFLDDRVVPRARARRARCTRATASVGVVVATVGDRDADPARR